MWPRKPPMTLPKSRFDPLIDSLKPNLNSDLAWELKNFTRIWTENRGVYDAIAVDSNIPPHLVAAIHYRECSGNFHCYLHQGDRLGFPAINEPRDIPEFPDSLFGFRSAAVHALNMKARLRVALNIDAGTTCLYSLCQYAENYNGLGYFIKGKPSPYILSGTTGYISGKYITDHRYDETAKDKQIGILPMLWVSCGVARGTLPPPAVEDNKDK